MDGLGLSAIYTVGVLLPISGLFINVCAEDCCSWAWKLNQQTVGEIVEQTRLWS